MLDQSNTTPLFLPPLNFRSAEAVQWAEFKSEGPFDPERFQRTGARGAGNRYERKAQLWFEERYSSHYRRSPWIKFVCEDSPRTRWAQPDGLLVDNTANRVTVIEFKIRHTQNAWWGLRKLYEPLVRFIFGGGCHYSVCEVCKTFDFATAWPEPFVMVEDPMSLPIDAFGVHVWNGSKDQPRLKDLKIAT